MPAVARARRTTAAAAKDEAAEAKDYIKDGADTSDEADPNEDAFEPDDEDTVAERSSHVQSGWKAALDAAKNSGGGFTNEFKFTEDAQLVKFLDNEPFAVYEQHWIERQGKRSFICLGADCPLCDKGDTPKSKTAFSVLNLSAEEPTVEMLVAGPTMLTQLAGLDSDTKTGPLDRAFWALSKKGQKKQTTYQFLPVKPRDLDEDWGVDQAEMEALVEEFEPLDKTALGFTPRTEMIALAREMNG